MTAGRSAELEARQQLALAEQYEAAAAEARATAGRYDIAAITEKRIARALAPLATLGVTFLADRRWPGSRHAQVDLITVGAQGAFIADTKAWKNVTIHGDRIHRGDGDGAERERWELLRRELFVGMTRARDGLWVGLTSA
jgi:hypothetical protein